MNLRALNSQRLLMKKLTKKRCSSLFNQLWKNLRKMLKIFASLLMARLAQEKHIRCRELVLNKNRKGLFKDQSD